MKKRYILGLIFIILTIIVIVTVSIIFNKSSGVSCELGDKKCSDSYNIDLCLETNTWQENFCQYGCSGSLFDAKCNPAPCNPSTCNSIGAVCGWQSNGCDSQINCGSCNSNQYCSNGKCITSCIPKTCYQLNKDCSYQDDGCGNSIYCGSCGSNQICSNGKCINVCTPNCQGKQCGSDGCGGTWGSCDYDEECKSSQCQYIFNTLPSFSTSYDLARKNAGISDSYLAKENYYDYQNIYSSQSMVNYYNSLKQMTPKNAIKSIGKYVYSNVKYNTDYQTLDYCRNNRASDILNNGNGVCSTMSRVDIAMLRGIGIIAREKHGCYKEKTTCNFQSVLGIGRVKTSKLVMTDDGNFVLGGNNHAWIEVWIPESGWNILESTNGALYEDICGNYKTYTGGDECQNTLLNTAACLIW